MTCGDERGFVYRAPRQREGRASGQGHAAEGTQTPSMQLARDIGYASCYSFKYSARPGTPAANMQNLVMDHIASERLSRFQALINEQQLAFNKKCEGIEMDILFEKKGKKEGLQASSKKGKKNSMKNARTLSLQAFYTEHGLPDDSVLEQAEGDQMAIGIGRSVAFI